MVEEQRNRSGGTAPERRSKCFLQLKTKVIEEKIKNASDKKSKLLQVLIVQDEDKRFN